MIRFDDVHAIRLIAQACNIQFVPSLHHCIATYSDSDRLEGGVLFTDFWGGSVAMHVAGFRKGWGNRAIIYLAFDYPFRQLGCKKLFAIVPQWNIVSRNTSLHIGFKIEYLVHDVFNMPEDVNGMFIMSMRKEDCKWLNMPMPFIEYAPLERTNRIDLPLAILPTIGGMQ
jgi:RimJ/RimL family protein N-acetyltransferase